jgi:ATP-binding cassette subfamily F protein 3
VIKELPARKSKEQKRHEAEVRNRFYRQTQELREKTQEVEASLERATEELQGIESRLADPEVYRKGENISEMVKAHGDLKKRVEALTAEWETLAQQVEELERLRESQMEVSQ